MNGYETKRIVVGFFWAVALGALLYLALTGGLPAQGDLYWIQTGIMETTLVTMAILTGWIKNRTFSQPHSWGMKWLQRIFMFYAVILPMGVFIRQILIYSGVW